MTDVITVTISGSFRKFINEIGRDLGRFERLGVRVLSPQAPHVTGFHYKGEEHEFALLEGDWFDDDYMNEERHLRCIAASDFLWVVAPNGYFGASGALEMGYAIGGRDIPILGETELDTEDPDKWLFVGRLGVLRLEEAVDYAARRRRPKPPPHILVDPEATMHYVARLQDQIEHILRTPEGMAQGFAHPDIQRRHEVIEDCLATTHKPLDKATRKRRNWARRGFWHPEWQ